MLNSGFVKMVNLSADGREQIVGLKFRGDWLGLDGIADGVHDCDAVALDTGEVWAIPYDALLAACAPGISIVNIDNGVGAAVAAVKIARLAVAKAWSVRSRHTLA